jgi:hypothetical protein
VERRQIDRRMDRETARVPLRKDRSQRSRRTDDLVRNESSLTRPLKLTWPSVAALLRVHAAERQSFGRRRALATGLVDRRSEEPAQSAFEPTGS